MSVFHSDLDQKLSFFHNNIWSIFNENIKLNGNTLKTKNKKKKETVLILAVFIRDRKHFTQFFNSFI